MKVAHRGGRGMWVLAAVVMGTCRLGLGSGTTADIRTPAAPATPRVNGPTVFGVRPGSDVDYKIPATGAGTISYSVIGLPAGLSVNSATGMITGTLNSAGDYHVTLKATNSLGTSTKNFTIKVGDTIQLTPAMGWNSWNVWGTSESAAKWQTAADQMASLGLINYGWTYVNTDDNWQGARGGTYNGMQGNSTFLTGGYTMQGVIDHIHSLGLKAGLYSTPWIQSYGGFIGGSANNAAGTWTHVSDNSQKVDGSISFAQNDANQWAAWGVDYVKYDWNPRSPNPVSNTQFHNETAAMQAALKNVSHDVVYSYSNSMPFDQISDQAPMLNSWRITGDISDSWTSMNPKGFGQDKWAPYVTPGHFIDPDMLEIGYVGKSANPHLTNLTADEQYTHITIWSLLSAPLLLGCDLTRMDAFTMNLITNPEVIAVDQDALCKQALRVVNVTTAKGNNVQVYEKELEDGTIAVGLFNLGGTADTVSVNWSTLGLDGPAAVRDLWRESDMGSFDGAFSMTVASHSAELVKISAAPEAGTIGVLGAAVCAIVRRKRGRGR